MKEMFVFEPIYFNAESIAIGQQQFLTLITNLLGETPGWNHLTALALPCLSVVTHCSVSV